MADNPPKQLRDYLAKEAPDLATPLNALWQKSGPLHDRQNRPDNNENGRKHVEQVEHNIWRLLTETRHEDGKPNLDHLTPREVFLLSAAACCHDFDKALKSDLPSLPGKFVHGKDSADFIMKKDNYLALGIDKHQAKDIAAAIGIHDLKSGEFEKGLENLSANQLTPDGSINLRRVAVLLKAADILHCDHSRIQDIGINLDKLADDLDKEKQKRERSKYSARGCTRGWGTDGTRVLIQADPDPGEQLAAFCTAFQFMTNHEWKAVAAELEHLGFPHRLTLHPDTAKVVKLPDDAELQDQPAPAPHHPGPTDLLQDYPEPQDKWVGRINELAELNTAWLAPDTRLYTVVGFGGEGKTALARRFTESLRRAPDEQSRPLVIWWSFYFNKAADDFFSSVLNHFNIPQTEQGHPLSAELRARKLADLLRTGHNNRRLLLVLDGLEPLQDTTAGREGHIADTGLRELLRVTLNDAEPDTGHRGMILVTTREPLTDVHRQNDPRYGQLDLDELSIPDGVDLLIRQYGLNIDQDDAERFVKEVGGHALTLTLTGAMYAELPDKTSLADLRAFIASEEAKVTDQELTTRQKRFHRLPSYVLRHCAKVLTEQERQFLRLLSCCIRPATRQDVEQVFLYPLKTNPNDEPFNNELLGLNHATLRTRVITRLIRLRLIHGRAVDEPAEGQHQETGYDMHPLVRRHFYEDDPNAALTEQQRNAVHSRFYDVLPARQPKHYPDTMEEMRPVIDAVQHGCRAGRAQAALDECYYTRIGRKDQPLRTTFYLNSDLGAAETNLELLQGFFANGSFADEPIGTPEGYKAYLIGAAGHSLMYTGRPDVAIPLVERSISAALAEPNWANASVGCRNLCESHMSLGDLTQATEAASNALDYAGKMPVEHQFKNGYTQLSHALLAAIAGLCGDDHTASGHFAAAIRLDPDDWLASLPGCWHCMWLARDDQFGGARSAAQKNTEFCQEEDALGNQTFALAMQALVGRLAWAADDPDRANLEVMTGYARHAIDIGWRSGHHFYLTHALLEAGRCAVTRARHEPANRQAHVIEAVRYLDEAEQRAADSGYRLILADLHVARAELAKLAGDEKAMHHHCDQAIAICDEPDCGYAWAKQDAQALLNR